MLLTKLVDVCAIVLHPANHMLEKFYELALHQIVKVLMSKIA